jgi:hypothetical protein
VITEHLVGVFHRHIRLVIARNVVIGTNTHTDRKDREGSIAKTIETNDVDTIRGFLDAKVSTLVFAVFPVRPTIIVYP